MFNLGYAEIGLILLFGVLLFGKRLPQVGRYIAGSIVEFKKGIGGLEDDLDNPNSRQSNNQIEQTGSEQIRPPQRVAPTAPKFEENSTAITTPPQV